MLPEAALGGDAASDTVAGHCMPDSPYRLRVDVTIAGRRTSLQLKGSTGPDGNLSRHLDQDLRDNDFLELACSWPSFDTYTILSHAH